MAHRFAAFGLLDNVFSDSDDTTDSDDSDSSGSDISDLKNLLVASVAEQLQRPPSASGHPPLLHRKRPVKVEDYTDTECRDRFRFGRVKLRELVTELDMPARLRYPNSGNYFDSETALLICLRRMARTVRLTDLREEFNMNANEICMAGNAMMMWVDDNYTHLVDGSRPAPATWTYPSGLSRWAPLLAVWAAAVVVMLGFQPLPAYGLVYCFIDGVFHRICRPGKTGPFADLQRSFYTRYKKAHGLIFQAVMAPNGLFIDVWGPACGRHGDPWCVNHSGIVARMLHLVGLARGPGPYTCYGDAIYTPSLAIRRAIRGVVLPQIVRDHNQGLNKARTSVEHGFAKASSLWQFLDVTRNHQLLLCPVGLGKAHRVAFFFTNCHTCCYGSQTSSKFGCAPPSLSGYLRGEVTPHDVDLH